MTDLNALAQRLSRKISLEGKLKSADSKNCLTVINPATSHAIAEIACCAQPEIDEAVSQAHKAQKMWRKTRAQDRGQIVHACGRILQEHSDELARLMSYETGKALRTESRVELSVLADTFSFYAGLALELKGETIPFDPHMLSYTIREPLGVIAAIIPWNVPLFLMAMKIAPALVAGNTVVLKPSPEASLSVLRACELMNEVLPPGTLSCLTGDGQTGSLLVAHPLLNKVTFTGSVESGRKVYENAAHKIIPVTLELGGKSPMIIFEDADLEKAVESAYAGMRFSRAGQSCSASSRLFVHQKLFDAFLEKLLTKLNGQRMGDPLDEKTDIGTLISMRQYEKVQQFLKAAHHDPALTVHYASALPTEEHLQKGLFIRPALITGAENNHPLCQQEIFGPVASLLPWADFDEVILKANESDYGLAAGVWTRNITTALKAVQELDAGFVQVNQYIVFRPSLPFGGFKTSGLGKEASLDAMLENYTKCKTIIINTQN